MSRPLQAPGTVPLHDALDRSDPLRSLLQRVQASNDCHAIVRGLLPAGLREQVKAGPIDAEGWVLLVPSGSAASKLRQLLPRLEEALKAQGRTPTTIKVKVQPTG
jgi:hypothetical protein